MDDLVSIIMPSYNTADYILKSIESVLMQTYTNWELLIVDDCSSDNTREILDGISDERIKVYYNEQNSGAALSRNKALREAKGKWIAFLDSDDLWTSDKLEKQISFMKNNDYHFSYTEYAQIDEKGNNVNTIVSGPQKITKHSLFNYCWMGCLTVMYDSEFIGLVQIEDLKKNNDYAMWLKISRKATCYLLKEKLGMYRIRSGSISRQSKLKLIKHHYYLFRIGEGMNPLLALYYTCKNIIWGVWKKIHYVKTIESRN